MANVNRSPSQKPPFGMSWKTTTSGSKAQLETYGSLHLPTRIFPSSTVYLLTEERTSLGIAPFVVKLTILIEMRVLAPRSGSVRMGKVLHS
jgi:hypothetical protein